MFFNFRIKVINFNFCEVQQTYLKFKEIKPCSYKRNLAKQPYYHKFMFNWFLYEL